MIIVIIILLQDCKTIQIKFFMLFYKIKKIVILYKFKLVILPILNSHKFYLMQELLLNLD